MLSREYHMGGRRFKTFPRLLCDVLQTTGSHRHTRQSIKGTSAKIGYGGQERKIMSQRCDYKETSVCHNY